MYGHWTCLISGMVYCNECLRHLRVVLRLSLIGFAGLGYGQSTRQPAFQRRALRGGYAHLRRCFADDRAFLPGISYARAFQVHTRDMEQHSHRCSYGHVGFHCTITLGSRACMLFPLRYWNFFETGKSRNVDTPFPIKMFAPKVPYLFKHGILEQNYPPSEILVMKNSRRFSRYLVHIAVNSWHVSLSTPSIFHSCDVSTPSIFHSCDVSTPSIFHSCDVSSPSIRGSRNACLRALCACLYLMFCSRGVNTSYSVARMLPWHAIWT